jgi:hypothetical protein
VAGFQAPNDIPAVDPHPRPLRPARLQERHDRVIRGQDVRPEDALHHAVVDRARDAGHVGHPQAHRGAIQPKLNSFDRFQDFLLLGTALARRGAGLLVSGLM